MRKALYCFFIPERDLYLLMKIEIFHNKYKYMIRKGVIECSRKLNRNICMRHKSFNKIKKKKKNNLLFASRLPSLEHFIVDNKGSV